MPFLNFGGNKISIVICPTWISLWKIWKIGTRIRIHFGTGSGSTFSKCGSEDPDPDPLLRKGGSEDPDPLFPNVDPRIRIRIHVKMRWIRNAGFQVSRLYKHIICTYLRNTQCAYINIFLIFDPYLLFWKIKNVIYCRKLPKARGQTDTPAAADATPAAEGPAPMEQ